MSEAIWTALVCFAAGMTVMAFADLIRDLIVTRRIKREMKQARAAATLEANEGTQP